MADFVTAEALKRLVSRASREPPSSHTSTRRPGVKAMSDICCTSSNAVQVVESIPEDQAHHLRALTGTWPTTSRSGPGRENIIAWDGYCYVHDDMVSGGAGKGQIRSSRRPGGGGSPRGPAPTCWTVPTSSRRRPAWCPWPKSTTHSSSGPSGGWWTGSSSASRRRR